MNKDLSKVYYNLLKSTAYTGADKVLQATRKKYKSKKVIEWLEGQDAYNSHKLVRRRFQRRSYNVRNFDDLWEADLMDMSAIKTYNDDYVYILIVVDVLSKFAWMELLKNKTSKSVANAFDRILTTSGGRVPVCLQTDKGKEFIGREMQDVLKRNNILYRVARSPDTKAAVAERLIRTIKERVWRYFTHKNTRRYVDVLETVVDAYNHSKHSATKMEPASVTIYNAAEARKNLIHRYRNTKLRQPRYNIGDLVRVSRARNVFAKGYEGGWTVELFKISRVSSTRPPIVYFLKDLGGEEIDGFFYEEELSRVWKDLNKEVFEIEEVLKTSGRGRNKKCFVRWKGYPDKFNSWVSAIELKALQ